MDSVKILTDTDLKAVASPFRQKLMRALAEPRSAASIAGELNVSRQRIGYHMRDLERSGCIELVGEQPVRGLTERLYRARPIAFAAGRPADRSRLKAADRFSWRALVELVAIALRDLIVLRRRADRAGKRLATLALDAELRFDSPAERKAWANELVGAVEAVCRRYEKKPGAGGRSFRMVLGAYPALKEVPQDDE